ncbi:hypothetical protein [Streptomyces atrovirens]|uniref:Uncharacterized protein n=1 Tax=Streptomyces atrovirens TaxID=285556 RepID=A0ABW0DXG6_9ACTN
MPDDLYTRYMAASTAHRRHIRTCAQCTTVFHCTTGTRLYEAFSRLQDAYLTHRRNQCGT